MAARAASGLLVSALIRHVEAAGGHGMVLAKGDATAGTILIQLAARGVAGAILERMPTTSGHRWTELAAGEAYLADRRRSDPDLWIVELDHPEAATLALRLLEG